MNGVQGRGVLLEAAEAEVSLGSLSLLSGPCLTLWSTAVPQVDTMTNCELRLEPDRPIILGRSEGSPVPYFDPLYTSTTMVPGGRQTMLLNDGRGTDLCVSRGHLMLRFAPRGILLVNGVPQVEAPIRPPLNGTLLIYPILRRLAPCEEDLIEKEMSVILGLPNGAEIQISAA
jgi:hypothetical protein